jgi:adenylate kinase family enzyme
MTKKKISRIHIVGIYGSGKSTLAKKLSALLKIKTYDLDEIKYKRKYDIIRPVKERLKKVKEISNKKSWITEGAWTSYALELYKKADLVIFLQIPKWNLYKRIFSRHFKRKFHKYNYQDNGIKSTFNIMKKVHQYYQDPEHFMTLDSHKDYLRKYSKEFLIIKNNKDIKELMKKMK